MPTLGRPFPTREQLRDAGINVRPLAKSDQQEANRQRAQERFDKEDAELSPLNQEARDIDRQKNTRQRADDIFDDF